MPQEPSTPTGLQWGQCVDCGAPSWVPTDAPSPNATGTRVHPECAAQAADLEADLAHSNAFARALMDGPSRPRHEEWES